MSSPTRAPSAEQEDIIAPIVQSLTDGTTRADLADALNRLSPAGANALFQQLIAAGIREVVCMLDRISAPTGFAARLRAFFGGTVQASSAASLQSKAGLMNLLQRLDAKIVNEERLGQQQDVQRLALRIALPAAPRITVIEHCVLQGERCIIDGREVPAARGAWAFFLPEQGYKILYAVDGRVHCTHPTAPSRQAVFDGSAQLKSDRYQLSDWVAALSKHSFRRTAENHVAATRLANAGIGPAVHGCVIVRNLVLEGSGQASITAGIHVDNLARYPRKRNTTGEALLAAGVTPDRIMSCLRQQIRGYVSDLNSVVGVQPIDAEGQVRAVEKALHDALH